jgi:hypothetical protein
LSWVHRRSTTLRIRRLARDLLISQRIAYAMGEMRTELRPERSE